LIRDVLRFEPGRLLERFMKPKQLAPAEKRPVRLRVLS